MNSLYLFLRIVLSLFGLSNILGAIWYFPTISIFVSVSAIILGVLELLIAITLTGKIRQPNQIFNYFLIICVAMIAIQIYPSFRHEYGIDWGAVFLRIIEISIFLSIFMLIRRDRKLQTESP